MRRRYVISWLACVVVMLVVLRLTRDSRWGLDVELAVIAASIGVGGAVAKRRNQAKGNLKGVVELDRRLWGRGCCIVGIAEKHG